MIPTPDRRRPVAAVLALLAAASALCTTALFRLAVRTAEGQRLDDAARGDLPLSSAPRAAAATRRLLDTISISSLALLGLGIVAVALLRRSPARAVGAAVLVAGANITTQAIKAHYDRPDLVSGGPAVEGAFPSGHVTVAMSLAMGLVLVAPASFRWAAAVIGCVYAAGVGVAVIALDWHRPSEVVGAYLVAVGWTAAVACLVTLARRRDEDAGGGRAARAGGLIAAVLGLAFLAVAGTAAARRLDVVRIVDDRTAFAAGAAVCVAVCVALCALVAALLQRADSDDGARRAPDR